tara:strand:- start:5564 stop:5788 length:225 start_codon:yes stop_codon:yes gene_type:complete
MRNIFKDHPNSVGETYFQHFFKACSFGIKLLLIAIKAFVHAIFPFLFEHSASEQVSKLHDTLQSRKKSINSDKN